MTTTAPKDAIIDGGGSAGLSTRIFTARHGLDMVVDSVESILQRNVHIENFPGFTAGVNPRRLLDLMSEQAKEVGCEPVQETITDIETTDDGFRVGMNDGDCFHTKYVTAATKNEENYPNRLSDIRIIDRGKRHVTDECERPGDDGLYVAGRLAGKPYQTNICFSHRAEVAVALLEDDWPFYHDWVTPMGYFTGRGRDLPPMCEEIDDNKRQQRQRRLFETVHKRCAEPYPDEQVTHLSLRED